MQGVEDVLELCAERLVAFLDVAVQHGNPVARSSILHRLSDRASARPPVRLPCRPVVYSSVSASVRLKKQ